MSSYNIIKNLMSIPNDMKKISWNFEKFIQEIQFILFHINWKHKSHETSHGALLVL